MPPESCPAELWVPGTIVQNQVIIVMERMEGGGELTDGRSKAVFF